MRYAVVKDQLRYSFSKFHDTLEEAKIEAERLCQQEQIPFFIVKVLGCVFIANPKPPVKWEWEKENL